MKTEVIIHVGMHKTGTTFIQEEIFQRVASRDPLNEINYMETFDISNHIEEGKINIISDENLDGGSYRLSSNHKRRNTIAHNLAKLYPDAKVIVCIRNQKTWIRSAYKQFVLGYGAKDHSFKDYVRDIDAEVLDFVGYTKLLEDLFPSVHVCHFEDLVENPAGFIMNICKFIGIDYPIGVNYRRKNVAISDKQVSTIRKISRFLRLKELYFPVSVLIKLVRKDVKFGEWGRKV